MAEVGIASIWQVAVKCRAVNTFCDWKLLYTVLRSCAVHRVQKLAVAVNDAGRQCATAEEGNGKLPVC